MLVLSAGAWIASGHYGIGKAERPAPATAISEAPQARPFRVSVVNAEVVDRARRLTLSGRTEADQARWPWRAPAGFVTQIRVQRGSRVEKGEIIAILSDEAREAQVAQAQARVEQRTAELEAKRQLIEAGNLPRLNLVHLEAQFKAAEAALARRSPSVTAASCARRCRAS